MTEVIIKEFDNDLSILYKWARHFNIPSKLIIKSKEIKDEKEIDKYDSSIQFIYNLIQQSKTLDTIYNTLKEKLDIIDIVMGYTYVQTSVGILLSDILNTINNLYIKLGINKISDVEELKLVYNDWKISLQENIKIDLENLEKLEILHDELNEYPEILYSPIKLDKVTIKTSPVLNTTKMSPSLSDFLDIFDNTKLSTDVPYIRYNNKKDINNSRQELFKLYRGKIDEDRPDYEIIVPSTSQNNKDYNFYFTVWTGKGELNKLTKESYIYANYNIQTNILTFKSPVETDVNPDIIINKINKSLDISIDNYIKTGISGEFYLFNLEINDIYLIDMILNTDLMSSYLFVKETITPYAEKTQIKIYFRTYAEPEQKESKGETYIVTPSSVNVSLTQQISQGGEIVMIEGKDGPTKYRLPANLPYVKGKITQAESMSAANHFLKIFSRLMSFYKEKENEVKNIYTTFIPELEKGHELEKEIKMKDKATKKTTKDTKIERLKDMAPELFVNKYARKCQCPLLPIIIPSDEINAWENNTFLYKDVIKKRQVMRFPPDNPKWNFVCPNDSYPFPGVQINKDLPNKELYPCRPCCFKDDQMDPNIYSNYNKCFRGKIKTDVKESKETHKIKTDKILFPGRYGYLPGALSQLISKYSPEAADIVRIGVPHSVNSLIHCISMAVQDPTYINLESNEEKEKYVTNMRNIISKTIIPTLLKQEMYDFSDEKIMSQLSDNEQFLDPSLFYRALEESYNINIYVFKPLSKESSGDIFELPRFKLFHAKSPRLYRRAVLIYKTEGAESESLPYPQCELIIDQDTNNNKIIYSFGDNMNILLYNAFISLNRTITWNLDFINEAIPNEQLISMTARDNIYSIENYYNLFNRLPTHQILDGYGKTRAFIFPVGDENITIIIPATQPENLPIGEISKISFPAVINIFGEPNAITKNLNGMTSGFWYKVLDIEFGIYIPIIETPEYSNLKIGPTNPLIEESNEVISRITKLKTDLDIILQILKWLFILSEQSLGDFVSNYIINPTEIGPGEIGHVGDKLDNNDKVFVKDSSLIYDFSKLNSKFPVVGNITEGINILKDLIPSLFRGNKIYLYSEKFYRGILYLLKKYDYEEKGAEPVLPTIIYKKDIRGDDFTQQERVAIFTNEKDMRTWMGTLDKLSFKNIIIESELNISNALRTEPYIYSSPSGNIYLIQNVTGGDLTKALNVAYNWEYYKTNTGHKTDKMVEIGDDNNLPPYIIYGISASLTPVLTENKTGGADTFFQILTYGGDNYAAMLPLL